MKEIMKGFLNFERATKKYSDDRKIGKLVEQGIITNTDSYKMLKKMANILMEVEEMVHTKASYWTVSRINKAIDRIEKMKRMQNGSMNMVKAVHDTMEQAKKQKKEDE